jgi:hypothetical protein
MHLDFSAGEGLGFGLLFGILGIIFIPFSIFVIIAYLRSIHKLKEWTKSDYYALLLTIISVIMLLLVGNSR